jgi:hypothetical protein
MIIWRFVTTWFCARSWHILWGLLCVCYNKTTHLSCLNRSCWDLQEFISTCEALELVPENELELSRQGRPETAANRREQKVRLVYPLPPYNL